VGTENPKRRTPVARQCSESVHNQLSSTGAESTTRPRRTSIENVAVPYQYYRRTYLRSSAYNGYSVDIGMRLDEFIEGYRCKPRLALQEGCRGQRCRSTYRLRRMEPWSIDRVRKRSNA
jgi:hypothetical protein